MTEQHPFRMASLSVREHSLVRPLVFTLPVKLSAT